MFPKLNFPEYHFKFKMTNGKKQIFDNVRKKFILLTPEEWVRQHVIKFLYIEKKYPISLVAIEKSISINNMNKRCDVVFYNNKGNPKVIIECKAPDVNINQKVFDQIARYSSALNPALLIVTNGINHFCFGLDIKKQTYVFIKTFPTLIRFNLYKSHREGGLLE